MEHIEYFESMEEFLNFVRFPVQGFRYSSSRERGLRRKEFTGTYDFPEAFDLAINGWKEGTEQLEKYTSQFTSTLDSLLQIDDYYYDVVGQDFDLDRVLIGEPECWLASEPIQVQAPALHTLKIVANIGTSASISKETIMYRGSAIAALIGLLEKSRRRVELELVSRAAASRFEAGNSDSKANCTVGTIKILAKKAGDDLDLGKLAFMLAHPSMLRRMIHAGKENFTNRKVAQEICSNIYGYSINVVESERGDIYAPRMYSGSDLWNEKTAKTWILEELKKQGVELKGE